MEKLFNVGKITNTHGIKGEVRVRIMTDNDQRFTKGGILYVETEDDSLELLTISNKRFHKNHLLLLFEEITSLTEAEKLKGKLLKVKEEQLPPLPENEFYIFEIMGCHVYTTEQEYIGKVTDIIKTGANDVWELTREDGEQHLIPFIKDVVKEVRPDKKKILIELMEGLLE